MGRLLALLVAGILGVGIATSPALASQVPMPDLNQYVTTGVVSGWETTQAEIDILITIREYNLPGNEQAPWVDARAYFIAGHDKPFLVVIFPAIPVGPLADESYNPFQDPVLVYADPNETGYALNVVSTSVGTFLASGVKWYFYLPPYPVQ